MDKYPQIIENKTFFVINHKSYEQYHYQLRRR
nr:MAG TPA: hypothetical protein [Caudoviricetes sp.]